MFCQRNEGDEKYAASPALKPEQRAAKYISKRCVSPK